MAHWHQQKSNIDNPSLLICRFSILVDSNIWAGYMHERRRGRLRRTRMRTPKLYRIAAAVIDDSKGEANESMKTQI